MSSQSQALTPQQMKVLNTIKEFAALLLPAKLVLDHRDLRASQNLILLAIECKKNGWGETPAALLQATKNLLASDQLQWYPGFEPAQLKLLKASERPTVQDPLGDQRNFTERVRQGEAVQAKKDADAATFVRIDAAINALHLKFKHTTQEKRDRLRKDVEDLKARNVNPEYIFKQVKQEVARLHREEEQSRERL
jgi:hypothetical protein